ncbi:MAG: bifunctional (p)ppGpp synthetase/guanosine-3',5'-bis(diphosphate) 3'-pyrophosphohydrolase [Crocinitomicaceae bacterium]|nr:bifunctional (p)ppGpp synthetase/guanosine-3',5'-bis(diphosphate) 3'-pyrophosphohydrolase [Crocinitomicaceae bacterium]
MIQEVYQKAMKFAGEAHKDQKVPGTNANYLLHISNVAMEVIMAYQAEPNFDLELAVQIAILHDSIEDTDLTTDDLAAQFGEDVAIGVQVLTKDPTLESKSAKMKDSLNRIRNCPFEESAIVKLADRITNLQEPPANWSVEKRKNYLMEAEMINTELAETNHFLNNRLASKIKDYSQWI